jgi:hypothetical protein
MVALLLPSGAVLPTWPLLSGAALATAASGKEKDVGEKRKFQSADEGDFETCEKRALENVHRRSPLLSFALQMIASR